MVITKPAMLIQVVLHTFRADVSQAGGGVYVGLIKPDHTFPPSFPFVGCAVIWCFASLRRGYIHSFTQNCDGGLHSPQSWHKTCFQKNHKNPVFKKQLVFWHAFSFAVAQPNKSAFFFLCSFIRSKIPFFDKNIKKSSGKLIFWSKKNPRKSGQF